MYYYNNELPPQQGWICPKCGRVNAPWLPTCGCVSSQTRATFDTTSLTAKQTEPMTYEDWHGFDEWRDERNEQTEPSISTNNAQGSGMIDSSGNTDCSWK